MKIEIETVQNGYVVKFICPSAISSFPDEAWVEALAGADMREAFEKLCYRLNEEIGVPYNKWGHENFAVSWNGAGHKIDDSDDLLQPERSRERA